MMQTADTRQRDDLAFDGARVDAAGLGRVFGPRQVAAVLVVVGGVVTNEPLEVLRAQRDRRSTSSRRRSATDSRPPEILVDLLEGADAMADRRAGLAGDAVGASALMRIDPGLLARVDPGEQRSGSTD